MKKKKSGKKKWIIWSIIIVLILLIVIAIIKKGGDHTINVAAEKAEMRTIIETVSANGKIQPEVDVSISPYISGEVIELNVKEGDEVNKGDLLAVIDPEIYKSNYDRMKASLNTQQANYANAKARLAQAKAQFLNQKLSYERNAKLWEQNVISKSEYDAAKSAFEVAEAEVLAAEESVKAAEFMVASAKASLNEAEENLRRTNIYAPNNGTVSELNTEIGERVVGASQFSSGTEIMKIADLNAMEVNVEVNENDIVRVKLYDTCLIEVDAYLNRKFKGVVTEIATSANTTGISADQVTNFDVKIRILRSSYKDILKKDTSIKSPFRPGMSATVDIQTETVRKALSVPIQAVTTRPDTSGKRISGREMIEKKRLEEKEGVELEDEEELEVVFRYEEGKAILTLVETGIQDNKYIEIRDGLEEGQEVITAPYNAVSKELKNNDNVNKVEKRFLFDSGDGD